MDLSMKWENGKLSLSCDKKDMQFNFLFNKLYPFFMPEQIYDVSQIMTESLSILINKLAFTGYHIKGIKTNSQGHVIFNADYNLERDLNSMDCYEYSNGKFYKKGSDTPATVTVKKNGSDLINDIFTSKSEYLTSFAMEHNTSNLPVPGKVIDAVSSNLEKNGGAVLTESGIKFKINEGNLNWDDSMAYQFELNELDEDNFIGHISFLATIDYSENTDILNAVFPLQYYNEYAVIGISYHSPLYGSKEEREMREQSRKDFNLPPITITEKTLLLFQKLHGAYHMNSVFMISRRKERRQHGRLH
jgi:hypothetical protein